MHTISLYGRGNRDCSFLSEGFKFTKVPKYFLVHSVNEYISTPLVDSSIVLKNHLSSSKGLELIKLLHANHKRTETAEEKLSLKFQLSPLSYTAKEADQDSFSELAVRGKHS